MKKKVDKHSLAVILRMAGRSVVLVGNGPVADAHRKMLERAGAQVVSEGSRAALAIVVDDVAAVSRMKVRGALVYVVDRPDLSDFTPADVWLPEPEPAIAPVSPVLPVAPLDMPVPVSIEATPSRLEALAAAVRRSIRAIPRPAPTPRNHSISLEIALAKGGPLESTEADKPAA